MKNPFSFLEVGLNNKVSDARLGTINDSVVDTKRLTTRRGVGHPDLVLSRIEPITPVQERLRSEVLACSVKRRGGSAIDLDGIGTSLWTNSPVYLHIGT